ncbi:hypothetical protein IMSHALPRED_003113 [Imshaugia aleurites]|uniref:Fungal N-terminal domain-containing protein n=1 Tax=Imshaugia aleurites TaxID=172621 RepID=A0A8H3J722_9LECA|nr:hypothetical protein IMSHALPRED_003113 [Imshaugia aleurites]
MDGVSIAASIVGIATAGVQVSIKLVTLATQVSTASDCISAIANDISLTSGALHQLGELMNRRTTDNGVGILNQDGLETTRVSAAMCERVFQEIEKEVKRASEHLRRFKPSGGMMSGEKIELSPIEKAKWPFLQPNIDILRADLRDAKSTLMLMLQVATLALSKRMVDASMSSSEHQDFIRAIVALELQRREERTKSTEQTEDLRSSGPNGTANPITLSSAEDTRSWDREPNQSFQALAGRRDIVVINRPPNNSLDRLERSLSLDPNISLGVGRPRGPETGSIVNLSSASPLIPPTGGNSNVPLSEKNSETQTDTHTRLQMFLLAPTVKDLFDKIELRWSMQSTNMDQMAIRKHMAKDAQDGLPSVHEMLQQLHAYEQSMVDTLISKGFGGTVLYLRRTRTDIQLRDILFKAVPGLQFVVQHDSRRAVLPSLAQGSAGYTDPRPSFATPIREGSFRHSRPRKGRILSAFESLRPSFLRKGEKIAEVTLSDDYTGPSSPTVQAYKEQAGVLSSETASVHKRTAGAALNSRSELPVVLDAKLQSQIPASVVSVRHYSQRRGSRPAAKKGARLRGYLAVPGGKPKEPDAVDEQEDQDAEAMVAGLLGKYTTLFDA